MLHTGYAKRPTLTDLTNVINFDMPATYNSYKESGSMISDEAGSILSLPMSESQDDINVLHLLKKKFSKNFGDDQMLRCLPVIWHQISKVKSRVESVYNHLSNKTVNQ